MKTLWALSLLYKLRAQELQTYKIPVQELV